MSLLNENKLSQENAVLVVVDMQEKLIPAMQNIKQLISVCEKLVRGCTLLDVPVIFTQQYTKGLGPTIPEIETAWKEASRNTKAFTFIDKTSFSVYGDPAFLETFNRVQPKQQIILCGVEAHVCVLQSALDFLAAGFSVFLAADAVSSRYEVDYSGALRRLSCAGGVITTTESVLFELIGGAKHPLFKDISNLVK